MPNPLFHIQLRHQYYDDTIWHHLTLKPDATTEAFLQRFRLVQRRTELGLSVYYYGTPSFASFVASLPNLLDGKTLRFYLHNSDASYLNISDLPLNWLGQLNYDSRDVVVREGDPALQVLNLQLAQRSLNESGVIGQVTIASSDLQAERTPIFVIEMAARRTHWFYYVCNRSQRNYEQLSVHNDEGIVFEPPKPTTLPTGEPALLFRSGKRTFAMKQTFAAPFHLVHLMAGADAHNAANGLNSQTLLQGLPIPQTDRLCIEHHNGQPYVYSPMYVYI